VLHLVKLSTIFPRTLTATYFWNNLHNSIVVSPSPNSSSYFIFYFQLQSRSKVSRNERRWVCLIFVLAIRTCNWLSTFHAAVAVWSVREPKTIVNWLLNFFSCRMHFRDFIIYIIDISYSALFAIFTSRRRL
jgi:hypothetical protein